MKSLLSPQLAHQVLWDRFVNTRGGPGRNIPCDLYNEHVGQAHQKCHHQYGCQLDRKSITESCSICEHTTLCKHFDSESKVPITSVHSTRTDKNDIQKVVKAVIDKNLLIIKTRRSHRNFHTMRLNPLWNWDKYKTVEWIEKRKMEFMKFKRITGD